MSKQPEWMSKLSPETVANIKRGQLREQKQRFDASAELHAQLAILAEFILDNDVRRGELAHALYDHLRRALPHTDAGLAGHLAWFMVDALRRHRKTLAHRSSMMGGMARMTSKKIDKIK